MGSRRTAGTRFPGPIPSLRTVKCRLRTRRCVGVRARHGQIHVRHMGEAEDVVRGGSFGLDGASADAGGGGPSAGDLPAHVPALGGPVRRARDRGSAGQASVAGGAGGRGDASLAERRAPDRADRQGALDNVNLFASGASASRTRFRHPRLFVVHARQGSDSIWLFDWLCASSCAKAVALAVCRTWGFSESVMGTVPAMRGVRPRRTGRPVHHGGARGARGPGPLGIPRRL